jgi:hypothetical protein
MVIVFSDEMGGAWLPSGDQLARLIAEHLPEARLAEVADGAVSRPDLTAAIVREQTARPSPPRRGDGEK